jgi:hypothetical protein
MSDANIASYVAVAFGVATTILGIVNHKRVRSTCCGREANASLDIEQTTPPGLNIKMPVEPGIGTNHT